MLKTTTTGISTAYERRGKGPALVLIHGYPLDHTIWEPLVPLLEKDFDLILPDVRGFGESTIDAGEYFMSNLAGDVAGLLHHLKIRQAFIAGHSMGGYIALAFAGAFPQRMLGLGLISTQAQADTPEKKTGRAVEAQHVLTFGVGEVAEGMCAKLTADQALQAVLKGLILRQNPQGLAGALGAMAARPDSTPFLAAYEFPVVLVHGLADVLIPVERARQVALAVKRGQLVEIEGTGHMPMMESPQDTAFALISLLESKT